VTSIRDRLGLSALLFISACGTETIVHKTDERQANKIIEVLAAEKVTAIKGMVDTGREVYFTISVPKSDHLRAIQTLNNNLLPTPDDMGYDKVFLEGGLIPTSAEENAKFLQALEGEIQRQLKLIDGILDVQVQVVKPKTDALSTTEEQRPDTTASVTVKYLQSASGSKPLSEPQVQAIVAAGVEDLNPDKVVVVMTPAGGFRATQSGPSTKGSTLTGFWGQRTQKELNMMAAALLGFVVLLGLVFVYTQMRLRTVRARLLRLQTEIARARRKPDGSVG